MPISGRTRRAITTLSAVLALLAGGAAGAEDTPVPAARVGDEVITLRELEQSLRGPLAKLEEQRHALLEAKLDELIAARLLAQEASRRGIEVADLLKAEVYGKTPEVTDAEVTEFMTQNRARLPQGDEAELKLKVWDYMRAQRVAERRQAYVQALRERSPVSVLLPVPAALRVPVPADRGFARGAAQAPVTIVEFSDFQCPFCKTATATVKQVMERYPGKVRWVFRDFPIATLHPAAPKAHEAARCAAEQGKFWEYHDVLFDHSPQQEPDDLRQYARDLALDATAFAQCLDSGRHAAAVAADLQEGAQLGVEGTPTFFVNGRQLTGSQPLTAFQKLIDGELARAAAR